MLFEGSMCYDRSRLRRIFLSESALAFKIVCSISSLFSWYIHMQFFHLIIFDFFNQFSILLIIVQFLTVLKQIARFTDTEGN